jgi:hypothetical protein
MEIEKPPMYKNQNGLETGRKPVKFNPADDQQPDQSMVSQNVDIAKINDGVKLKV